jgi:predicted TIM-barrel fold metal-dependent hydrolase
MIEKGRAMIEICDPHIHLWDLATGLYPGLETPSIGFIGDNTAIARSYLLPEYLAEAGSEFRITSAVHVEAFPTDPIAEVSHVQGMAERSSIPIGIVGNADLAVAGVGDALDEMMIFKNLRGIRKVVNLHPDQRLTYVTQDYLADPSFHRGFTELGKRGLSFDLQLYPHQMADAVVLARTNPDTQIILNHAGMWADRTLDGWRTWKSGLRVLASCPNIAVKISGLGMFDLKFTTESIRPLVLEVLEAFGAHRSMFASNFPVDKLFSTYPALWAAFDTIVHDLSRDERSGLFERNARRIYRL